MSGRSIHCLAISGMLAAAQTAFAEVPEKRLESPLASAFGAPPTIGDPMLSPDGTRLLFVQQDAQGVSMLLSLGLSDGELVSVLQGTEDGYDIVWCHFASETRVFCFIRSGMPERGPSNQQFLALNIDGTEQQLMPELLVCFRYDYLRDQPLIDWAPDDPDQILFLCGNSALTRPPELLDIHTGRRTNIGGLGQVGERSRLQFHPVLQVEIVRPIFESGPLRREQAFYANGHGLMNIYRGRQDNLDHWFVREGAESEWREFLTVDPLAFEVPFRPVGYGTSLESVFNIGWNSDSETWALYRQQLSGDFENELVFGHPAVDVQFVDTMGRHQRVVSAAFLEHSPRRAIVDERVAEVYLSLRELMPDRDIDILDESWDQTKYLARIRRPNRTGELVLVDMETDSVEPIGPEYDHLADVELAATSTVVFESSTGGSITGHLTLPPGAEGPVPAVVLPRARPTHEDLADPHYLVQFLAASGYAVLRVENRIDEAYGRGWLPERAVAGWRQSVADVRDAVGYLVENGHAELGRICGTGKDYGAYIALLAAIEYPELLSCIVSIAGMTDPREPRSLPGGELVSAVLLSEANDFLAQASPLRRAAELEAPMLMFHGAFDNELGIIDQMLVFERALERADKDVVAVEYPRATHAIKRKPDRVDMLVRIRGFLAEHIGPPLTEQDAASGAARWRETQ